MGIVQLLNYVHVMITVGNLSKQLQAIHAYLTFSNKFWKSTLCIKMTNSVIDICVHNYDNVTGSTQLSYSNIAQTIRNCQCIKALHVHMPVLTIEILWLLHNNLLQPGA